MEWSWDNSLQKMIKAFVHRCYRRLLGIRRRDQIKTTEVLKRWQWKNHNSIEILHSTKWHMRDVFRGSSGINGDTRGVTIQSLGDEVVDCSTNMGSSEGSIG